MIHAELAGKATGPSVVLVHGFTQTGRNWGPIGRRLAADYRLVMLDAPGHGRSQDAPMGLGDAADALADAGGRGVWVGYSMGGRYALHVALARPEVVERLVLVGATGGIDDAGERADRRRRDEALADRLVAVGLDQFLDEWLANPLFAGLRATPEDRLARTENTVAGLAASLRHAGTGTQEPLWDRLQQLSMPVLVVAGEQDEKFAALGRRLALAIGSNARLALIPEAGHAAHLEQPAAFVQTLRAFLDGG